MKRLVVSVVVGLILSLAFPGGRTQATHTVTVTKDRPVLFLHGVDAWDLLFSESSSDCNGWTPMMNKMESLGYNATKFKKLSYYHADKNCSFDVGTTSVEHHGSHRTHDGSDAHGNQGHENDGHNNEAYIQHLGYHLAWYI